MNEYSNQIKPPDSLGLLGISHHKIPIREIIDTPNLTYIKVEGNSMELAGIYSGDIAIISDTHDVFPGDIIAVLYSNAEDSNPENHAYIKTYLPKYGKTFLRSECEGLPVWEVRPSDNVMIIGKYLGKIAPNSYAEV
ncbi:MAG: hypothetical protein Kapaf2KO_04660 [Candidatus Kapaibacteriales bacterium]